nr:EOG090X026V [Lepidurus arcticus]
MEDFTEKLPKTNNAGEVFKKPVVFGKRPGHYSVILFPPKKSNRESENLSEKDSFSKSPAELLKEKQVSIPYKEPAWSGLCDELYSLEILKNGAILGNEDITKKPFWVFGRLGNCHIILEHPSISRHHAVLQYREQPNEDGAKQKGWYLYDLGSTHGTFLNKNQCHPKTYYRLHVGHVFKFGGSSRLFVVQGPSEDEEEESELTVTEVLEQRRQRERELVQKKLDAENLQRLKEEEDKKRQEEQGVDWGMGEDANEETDTKENPFAEDLAAIHEELYLDDPKKTLRGWFEREGYELEYSVEEKANGHFICRITLPVEGQKGIPLMAETSVKGKKKDAVVQCALEACRVLDRHGLLRRSQHEGREKKKRNYADDDYYSSDEDTFLDRTGSVEQKRLARMQAAGKREGAVETYETLIEKYEIVQKDIAQKNQDLNVAVKRQNDYEQSQAAEDVDALDAFMSSLKKNLPDRKVITHLKAGIITLNQEAARLRKLINIAKPASLPELSVSEAPSPKETTEPATKVPSLLGSLKKRSKVELKLATSLTMETTNKEQSEAEEDENEKEKAPFVPQKLGKATLQGDSIEKSETDSSSTSLPAKPNVETIKSSAERVVKPEGRQIQSTKDVSPPPLENQRVLGPTVPAELLQSLKRESQEESDVVQKKKPRRNKKNLNKDHSQDEKFGDYDATDPAYAVWLPPADQTGDGKTDLNRKLGY